MWEVKADYKGLAYRVVFAEEAAERQICLALELFSMKSQKTPPQTIALAELRLRDWRSRGRGTDNWPYRSRHIIASMRAWPPHTTISTPTSTSAQLESPASARSTPLR
jgi:hypothetical protein